MNSKYAKLLITLMLALLFCLPASGMAATSDEAIQVNPCYSHPVVEDVMYVTEGETVTIEDNPSCSEADATFVYFWMLGTHDETGKFVEEQMACREAVYSFVASVDTNGKYINYSTGRTGYKPGSFELKLDVKPKVEGVITLDVETSHPVVNDVLTVTEGETISINTNPACSDSSVELVHRWFLHTYDNSGECIDEVVMNNTASAYTFVATADMNGKHVYCEVYGKDVETNTAIMDYQLKVEPKQVIKPITLTVTPCGGQQGFVNGTKYLVEGETVPFRASATYEGDPVELTYTWYLETRDASGNVTSRVQQPCTESTYNLTAAMDQSGKYLTCYVEGEGLEPASASVKLFVIYQTVGNITLDVRSSHPVSNNVLTVTEGDMVTLTVTPSSPLENPGYHYFWFYEVRDADGETVSEEKLNCSGNTLTFRASSALNGKYVYCSVGADRLRPASFAYKLKVMTKVPELDEAYARDVEKGITTETLSEELKENPALNTPAKVETDITIKVLAEAQSAGVEVETVKEQTAVYDVTLMYSEDGGETFVEATRENWPESGKITVTLPYPEGTGRYTHTFVVAHMFTQTTADHKAGDVEYPAVTNTANGIQFQVSGLSPIAIAWDEKPAAPAVPQTGDNATPYLWMLCMAVAGIGCVALTGKRRKNI